MGASLGDGAQRVPNTFRVAWLPDAPALEDRRLDRSSHGLDRLVPGEVLIDGANEEDYGNHIRTGPHPHVFDGVACFGVCPDQIRCHGLTELLAGRAEIFQRHPDKMHVTPIRYLPLQ